MKATPSLTRGYNDATAKIHEDLSMRYFYKHVFPANCPKGFAIGDSGPRRGTGLTYFLPDSLGGKSRSTILTALDIFFNGSCSVAHITTVSSAIDEILDLSGLGAVLDGYITEDAIFGKYHTSRAGKGLFDLCVPKDATHIVIKSGWIRDFTPSSPLIEGPVADLPHLVRRCDIFDPFDAYVWPIGGVFHAADGDKPPRIVQDFDVAKSMRTAGDKLYRALSQA